MKTEPPKKSSSIESVRVTYPQRLLLVGHLKAHLLRIRHRYKFNSSKRVLEMPTMKLIVTILQYLLFAFFLVFFAAFSFFARALFI